MDLSAIMDGIAEALEVIDDLNAIPYMADRVTPPAAIVGFPETIDFDSTMNRGSDVAVFPVVVVVGRADARTSRDRVTRFVHGPASIKTAVESFEDAPWFSARVQSVSEFGTMSIAGVEYLSLVFNIHITASGD